MKFKAYDKNTKEYRNDVVVSSEGVPYVVRSTPEFNKLVNKWYKKNGEILGGDFAEIDYTDWYAINNITIEWIND